MPEVPHMVHWHHHDKREAQPAIAQFGSASFAIELPLGHD